MSVQTFWETVRREPDLPALVVDATGEELTYGELGALANRLTNGLRAHGLRTGDTVAVLMGNRVEFVAMILATQQAGLHLTAVNRHLTGGEAGYVLRDSGALAVVADEATAEAARTAADLAELPATARFATGCVPGFRGLADLMGSAEEPRHRTAGVRMIYSSGTTGRPKGIRQELPGVAPEVALTALGNTVSELGATPGGTYLSIGPLYHAAPYNHLLAALQMRQRVVLSSGFDPRQVLSMIERYRVSDAFTVPTMLHRLLTVPDAERDSFDLSSLACVVHGAAMCPVDTKRRIIDWWGPVLVEYYGSSESGNATMIDSADWLAHPGSVGRARQGMSIRICDPAGQQLPTGQAGLVHLSTGARFSYHGDEQKTRDSMHEGYFIPGDIGRLDEQGYLYLVDRRTDMIISGGVNIYPAEIEAEILRHPGVLDAGVLGVPDPEWGHSVVAMVQPVDPLGDAEALVAAVREHLAVNLAKYKIPREIAVVSSLPRNPAGKLPRAQLHEVYRSQAVR